MSGTTATVLRGRATKPYQYVVLRFSVDAARGYETTLASADPIPPRDAVGVVAVFDNYKDAKRTALHMDKQRRRMFPDWKIEYLVKRARQSPEEVLCYIKATHHDRRRPGGD